MAGVRNPGQESSVGEFPGGPVVRTGPSSLSPPGPMFIPGRGTGIPQAEWGGQKKKKRERKSKVRRQSNRDGVCSMTCLLRWLCSHLALRGRSASGKRNSQGEGPVASGEGWQVRRGSQEAGLLGQGWADGEEERRSDGPGHGGHWRVGPRGGLGGLECSDPCVYGPGLILFTPFCGWGN